LKTSVALVHHPCLGKDGETIATSITNLDLHDLARLCLTYGVDPLYIVHPYRSQLDFAERIMRHWLKGFGGLYNPHRKQAFETVRLVESLDAVRTQTGAFMVGTSANRLENAMTWQAVRQQARTSDTCLVFGTGWGLTPALLAELDAVAEPIEGGGAYNHLAVRSAVSIAIDRVLGR
jgi:hypothetical protein